MVKKLLRVSIRLFTHRWNGGTSVLTFDPDPIDTYNDIKKNIERYVEKAIEKAEQ